MNNDYIILLILSCILGSVVGSFLNLAIHRIPLKQNIVYKHSYCPNCQHELQFADLIPILSYVFIGGKCRHCKVPIKPRYLYVELLMLLIYALTFLVYGLTIKTVAMMGFYAITVLIAGMLIEKSYMSKGTVIVLQILNILYLVYKIKYMYDIMLINVILLILLLSSLAYMTKYGKEKSKIVIYIVIICSIFNFHNMLNSFILLSISASAIVLLKRYKKIRVDSLALFNIITLFLSLVYSLLLGAR